MNYIIDTCTLLWIINGSSRIPKKIIDIWEDGEAEVFASVLSFCELAIKRSKGGRVPSFETLMWEVNRHEIEVASLYKDDVAVLEKLPLIHKDPFDRLLIAQAIHRGAAIITPDKFIQRYPVKTVWE